MRCVFSPPSRAVRMWWYFCTSSNAHTVVYTMKRIHSVDGAWFSKALDGQAKHTLFECRNKAALYWNGWNVYVNASLYVEVRSVLLGFSRLFSLRWVARSTRPVEVHHHPAWTFAITNNLLLPHSRFLGFCCKRTLFIFFGKKNKNENKSTSSASARVSTGMHIAQLHIQRVPTRVEKTDFLKKAATSYSLSRLL